MLALWILRPLKEVASYFLRLGIFTGFTLCLLGLIAFTGALMFFGALLYAILKPHGL
jgi:hypothetical protein